MDINYDCPNCGKPLVYEENTDSYMCIDCGSYFNAKDIVAKNTVDEEKSVRNAYTDLFVEIQCKLCGKKTIVSKGYDYGVCPFCYNNLIDYNEIIVDFYPELIIPFKESQSQLLSHLLDVLKEGGCPPELINGVKVDSIKGLNIPFYKYLIESSYTCFLETKEIDNRFGNDGFYYQEIEYIDNLDVLCDASSYTIPNRVIDDIANFDYKKIFPYSPALLGSGFYTISEAYTHDKVWKELNSIVRQYTEESMKKYVGKTEEIKKLTLIHKTKNIVKKYILLPFWVIETNYNNEIHYLYINGQTHRVASDIDFQQPIKRSLFGKETVEKYQIRKIDEQKVKYKRFSNGIDYHNELRKYDSNSAEKDQRIGALRTK